MKKFNILLFVFFYCIQCTTVPITGRKQFNIVKDEAILPVSFEQYRGFLKENKLSTDKAKSNQIKAVGAKISKAVDKFMRSNGMIKEAEAYQWEFNLVEDKTVNAWCMPGGKVVFYTGILPICKNEDGIAAVMGHEVAHAFAKHGQERMSLGQVQAIGGLAVALGTDKKPEETKKLWNMVYGIGSGVGMLKYSRNHETEADKLGLVFMLMAGYNGEEAAEVWVRMKAKSNGAKPPEFLSTHPSHDRRIETLKAYLPEAKRIAAKINAGEKL